MANRVQNTLSQYSVKGTLLTTTILGRFLTFYKKKSTVIKDKNKTKERRPFDRDIDLHANRFDEAQKKAMIKKSANLDGRFTSGQSKYL